MNRVQSGFRGLTRWVRCETWSAHATGGWDSCSKSIKPSDRRNRCAQRIPPVRQIRLNTICTICCRENSTNPPSATAWSFGKASHEHWERQFARTGMPPDRLMKLDADLTLSFRFVTSPTKTSFVTSANSEFVRRADSEPVCHTRPCEECHP
jgi:hypothetical protein